MVITEIIDKVDIIITTIAKAVTAGITTVKVVITEIIDRVDTIITIITDKVVITITELEVINNADLKAKTDSIITDAQ